MDLKGFHCYRLCYVPYHLFCFPCVLLVSYYDWWWYYTILTWCGVSSPFKCGNPLKLDRQRCCQTTLQMNEINQIFLKKNLKETRPPVQRASITHQQSHTPIPNPKIDHTFFVYRVFLNRGYIGERGSATWKKFSLVPRFSYRTASLTPDRVAGTPLNAENQSIIIAASLKEEFLGGIYNCVHQSINISINQ